MPTDKIERLPPGRPIAPARPGWRLVTPLLIGSVLNPIDSAVLATALVTIGTAFKVGVAETSGLVAAFYLASAVGQPAMGRMAQRFGPRRVFLAGQVLVVIGGLLGTVAVNLPMLMMSRIILGVGTSAGYPTALMIIRRWDDAHPNGQVGGTLGALAVTAQVVAAVGLPLGGVLVAVAGWPIVFLLNVPIAAIGLLLTLCWIPRDLPLDTGIGRTGGSPPSLASALDVTGMALFAASTLCLLLFLRDLDRPVWPAAGLFLFLAGALICWESRAAHPFIDVRMIACNRALSATYLRVIITFLVIYCVFYGMSQWMEQGYGLSPAVAGLIMLPNALLGAVVSMIIARRQLMLAPLLITAGAGLAGSVSLLFVRTGIHLGALVLISLLFGLVSGLGITGNQTALYRQAPPEHLGVAAGLLRTAVYTGSTLSASVIGLTLGSHATDSGLHKIALTLAGLSLILLILTLLATPPPTTRIHRDRQGGATRET